MTRMIEARGLRKRFDKTIALDGLDLMAEPGAVVAVLGPNGAGKTTFVRAVATLVRPDGGSIRVVTEIHTRGPVPWDLEDAFRNATAELVPIESGIEEGGSNASFDRRRRHRRHGDRNGP